MAACGNVTWDVMNPVACEYVESSGTYLHGVCDPNGYCYNMGVSFGGAINRVKQVRRGSSPLL